MIIANGENVSVVEQILAGNNVGTLFTSNQKEDFKIIDYLSE